MVRALFTIVALLFFGTGAGLAAPPPLTAYGRLPAIENIALAPGGDRLAYVTVQGADRRLVIQELGGRALASLGVSKHKVRSLEWAGHDHVLIGVSLTDSFPGSSTRSEQFNAIAYNVKSKSFAILLDTADYQGSTGSRMKRGANVLRLILGEPVAGTYAGKPVAYLQAYSMDGSGSFDLFRVDLNTGKPQLHERGSNDTRDWVVRPDGTVIAREEFDGKTGRWKLMLRDGGFWKQTKSETNHLDASSLMGPGRQPGTVLMSTVIDGDRRMVELSVPDGRVLGEPLDAKGGHSDSAIFDKATTRLIGVSSLRDRREYTFYDPKLQTAWRSVLRGFPGGAVSLRSWTHDFGKLVVHVEGDQESGAYYLVDTATKQASEIGLAYPDVAPEQVNPQQAVTYKAADGLEIQGYLTTPVGRPAKGLPLVVLPHGGPEARDELGFDWWSQALASRGYAVLQPNYRGSSGYGRKFVQAGYGQWGRKMQTDLSDGVRWLATQGTVDPKRVCIVGASYGGYAALAGATIEPDMYRCAASVAGVSDLPRMLSAEAGEARTARSPAVRYWSRFMGAEYRDRETLAVVSPARLADRAKGPILLIHGKDDTVVPYEQTAIMARALDKAGKPYELVTLAGEDHWLSREATRLRMLTEIVRFLEAHNPPG